MQVVINEYVLSNVADAIRNKNDSIGTRKILPSHFASYINAIKVGDKNFKPLILSGESANSHTYTDEDGYNSVKVNIFPSTFMTKAITENGEYAPGEREYWGEIYVNVPTSDSRKLVSATFTENGTYYPPSGTDGFNKVVVDIPVTNYKTFLKEYIQGQKNFTLEDSGITKIKDYCFYSHQSLTNVSFPECSTIGDFAFYNAANLSYVNFPKCEKIGEQAFKNCEKITDVNLATCTKIGKSAFYNCKQLNTLRLHNTSIVCSIPNTKVFEKCDSLNTITVPLSLVSQYKTAKYWSQYADKIIGV